MNSLTGIVEGSILIATGILTFPCNMWAIANYKKKRMNKELLILIYALCGYNFLFAITTVLTGILRMLEYFPFGHLGCFFIFPFAALINNSTSLTLALISYERRSIVTSRMTESPGRVMKITGLLIFINIFTIFIYCFVCYYLMGYVELIDYPVHGPNEPPVPICVPLFDRTGFPADAIFSLCHFVFPFSITSYNYYHLIVHIRKHRSNNSAFEKRYKKHVFFSRLMIICLVEFVLSQIPFDFVLFIARIQDARQHRTLNASAYFIGYVFVCIDNIINPLWFSFASFKKRREKIGVLSPLILRPSSQFSPSNES